MPLEPFDQTYFQGDRPEGYTNYSREQWGGVWTFESLAQQLYDMSAQRGQSMQNRKVLVVGCAYGYGVQELVELGVDAYGLDISAWAISQAQAQLPSAIAAKIIQGDARVRANLTAARSLAGLSGNARFDVIVDEDLLTCFNDADAAAASSEWRSRHAQRVVHRLTTKIPNIAQYGYNVKSVAQWRTLLGAADWIFDYYDWTEG